MAMLSLCVITLLILRLIAVVDEAVDLEEFEPDWKLHSEDLPSDADLIIDVTHTVSDDDCKIKSRNGDTLVIHYTGTLYKDGSQFDSSFDRGAPYEFELGASRVIKGWDEGLLDMCIGEKRTLTIPSDKGYGDRGSGANIPPGATLVFETELLDIASKRPTPDSVVLTYDQYEQLKGTPINLRSRDEEFQIIAFLKPKSKRERLFDAVAKEMKSEAHLSFYKVYLDRNGQYKIVMRRNNPQLFGDELEVIYDGKIAESKKSKKAVFEFKAYDLKTWIQDNHMPLFIDLGRLDGSVVLDMGTAVHSVLYRTAKIPQKGVLLIRITEENEIELILQSELVDMVRQLRKDGFITLLSSRNEPSVGFIDGVNMVLILKEMDTLPSAFRAARGQPTVIEKFRRNYDTSNSRQTVREYRYQWFGEINSENLAQFYEEVVVDKSAKRWIRSAEEVKNADVEYEIITANSFNDVVLDTTSDVLVLYCKELKEMSHFCSESRKEYNKLAKYMKTHYKDKAIKIVYLDYDANDVEDVRVVTLPTMILYPAGSSTMNQGKLLSEKQQQTLVDIVDFIDEFAANLNKEEL
eukprot:984566_1